MTEKSKFLVHQLLHGYQDGHSLISSSLTPNLESKRTITVLTDMSGPSIQKGFEEYITGYPLVDDGYFAIAKTWYAAEMPRSGSVWTHTLLISFSDLPKVKNYAQILSAFVRPNIKDKNYKSLYSSPVTFRDSEFSLANPSLVNQRLVSKGIIGNLYSGPESNVIVKSKDSAKYESLILEVWFQQWPRLRREFTFCTGSIYPRKFQNKTFDLQVCPEKIERSVELREDVVIIDANSIENNTLSNYDNIWINEAIDDLEQPSILREFLIVYGADFGSNRQGYVKLLNFYVYFKSDNSKNDITTVVRRLAEFFPALEDGGNLKIDLLLNKGLKVDFISSFFDESDILFALATTEEPNAFDYESLKFVDRFLNIYEKLPLNSVNLLNRLLSNDINIWGERILKIIAENLDEDSFRNLAGVIDKKLAFALASQNSGILHSRFFWDFYKQDHGELFSILTRYREQENIDWVKIIDALVKTNSPIANQLGVGHIDLTQYFLDWANFYNRDDVSVVWSNLVRNNPTVAIHWLKSRQKVGSNVIRLLLNNLNPNSPAVYNGSGSGIWIDLMATFENSKDKDFVLQLSSFSLALAFNKPDKYFLELVSRSFERVYYALLSDVLKNDYWRQIEIHTTNLAWYQDWDKCKKLIDALFDNFREVRWSKSQISVLFFTDEVRERVQHRYKKRFG